MVVYVWRRNLHLRPSTRARLRRQAALPSCYWLLLLSGDIEANPGPSRYPCTGCHRPVRGNQQVLTLDVVEWVRKHMTSLAGRGKTVSGGAHSAWHLSFPLQTQAWVLNIHSLQTSVSTCWISQCYTWMPQLPPSLLQVTTPMLTWTHSLSFPNGKKYRTFWREPPANLSLD